MDTLLIALNNSKFVWGISMLVVNLGSRYVVSDLGKNHDRILNHPLFKPIIFFCIFFMATRDFLVAFLLTFLFFLIVMGFMHENSRFCFIPRSKELYTNASKPPTREEYLKALETIDRYNIAQREARM